MAFLEKQGLKKSARFAKVLFTVSLWVDSDFWTFLSMSYRFSQ